MRRAAWPHFYVGTREGTYRCFREMLESPHAQPEPSHTPPAPQPLAPPQSPLLQPKPLIPALTPEPAPPTGALLPSRTPTPSVVKIATLLPAPSARGEQQQGNQDFPNILASHGLESTTSQAVGDHAGSGMHPEYLAYGLVPVFFIMGLLGILICHVLKKKGYRCRTEAEQEIEKEKLGEKIEMNESVNDNNDTVGRIVNIIMENEANADMLKAMVADNSVCDPESPVSPNTPGSPTSPGSPLSPGDTPSKHNCHGRHLHTVGGVAEKDVCTRCSHKRWHLLKPTNKSKEQRKSRQGEVTVLSVGRNGARTAEEYAGESRQHVTFGSRVIPYDPK
ncbi:RELT-like protein 1 [Chelonia mydas]|uniref:RELT-like protein 1 n=1 Tax=Chelonia mydas TaxID=8469 RepID=M7BUY5_CHEMY|nr:RELT-like protein 1 [Chelonia mydas]